MNYQSNWRCNRGIESDEYEELTPLDYLAMRNRDALRDWRRRYFESAPEKQSVKASKNRFTFKRLIASRR